MAASLLFKEQKKIKLKYLFRNRQARNIFFSLLYRCGAIGSNLIIVPLLINQFSEADYGILVTVISITSWFSFIDFGLANGLKNKISENIANGEELKVRKYISTAYGTMLKVVICFILILFGVNSFVNWNSLIKAPETNSVAVNSLFLYGLLLFFAKLVVELLNPILLALHKTSVSSLISFISQVCILFSCYLLRAFGNQSLVTYGLVFFWVPLFTLFLFSTYFYLGPFNKIRPILPLYERQYEKHLLKLGGNFFVIQLAVIVIFTTDNLIVGRLFGYGEVGKYNIAFRYFNLPLLVLTIVLSPYWPLFSEWFVKKNFVDIKRTMKKLLVIWFIICLGALVMLGLADPVYKLWIDPKISIPFSLSLGMCLFCIISGWSSVYATFINGTNRLRLQLFSCVFTGLMNIPLSIFLAKNTSLGPSGVIFGTCICLLIGSVWAPIQYHKLVNNKAKGIWNR